MKAMQETHDKMRAARTPSERQALMADHMKAMRDAMAMMKERVGMGMADGMAKHHQMMAEHNAAMHLMMERMLDHFSPVPPAK